MRAEDALRKIGLLRMVKTENGALAAEADNAARLAKALMERYAIKAEDVPAASRSPAFRMTWIYWEELLHEFGLQLRHFGHRGNAAIGGDKIVYINLRTTLWWIERKCAGGCAERRSRLGRRIAAHLPQSARKRVLPLQTLTPDVETRAPRHPCAVPEVRGLPNNLLR